MAATNDVLASKIKVLEAKINMVEALRMSMSDSAREQAIELEKRLRKIDARVSMVELGLHTIHDFVDRLSAVFLGQPNA